MKIFGRNLYSENKATKEMTNTITCNELWQRISAFLRNNLSEQQFAAWFGSVTPISFENNELKISVPSAYYSEQFEVRFKDLLNAAFNKCGYGDVALIYCFNMVKGEPESAVSERTSDMSSVIMRGSAGAVANPFVANAPKAFDSQLNPRYNFENYCSGESNLVARTIAQAIADDPSNKTFNPLLIFGPTGVGKTHLIQAVGIRIKEKNPAARVLYVTARLFQSQYTAANHKGQINNFLHFYQSIDTLIVDDIQDLAGKPDTQNTFFYIFNQLHLNNRQIIMSSDCAPAQMDGFEARLLNRFKWGASAELNKPDYELRRKVLMKKAAQDGVVLSPEIIDYIAENVTDSIRELEGVVASLLAQATVLNTEISLSLAKIAVSNAIRIRRRQLNFEIVTEAVCSHFKLEPDTMFTKSRKREISDARQIVMYLSKKLVGMSFKGIGNRLGRTHATVIYSCNNIEERLPIDKELRADIEAIQAALTSE